MFAVQRNAAAYLQKAMEKPDVDETNKDDKSDKDGRENKGSTLGSTNNAEALGWKSLLRAYLTTNL